MNRKTIDTILAITILMAVLPVYAQAADDYFVYANWNPGVSYTTGVNGYVDDNGNLGDPGEEYLFFTGGPSYGGAHTAYAYKVETAGDPNTHPDNPNNTGPKAPRTFTLVNSHAMGTYASGHDNAFYVDDTGIYYGASDNAHGVSGWGTVKGGGIFCWDFDWTNETCVVPTPAPAGTQTLARNPKTGDWWVGTASRALYRWDGSAWIYQFTHPSLAGSHHDGMEIIGDSLFISDMTSDKIIQYRLNASGDVIDPPGTPYNTFTYTAGPVVEGMGFGPNRHIWISGYSSYTIYELGGGKLQLELEGIPDQCVPAGEIFDTFDLDDYAADPGAVDHYGYSGNTDLTVTIDGDNNVTITYPVGWTGNETTVFAAYNNTGGVIDSDDATFTVDPAPVVGDIPNQTAPFEEFDLDDYLSGIDPSMVAWSATYPGVDWTVDIDGDNVVTVTAPENATETRTITFTATATCCGGVVSDCDSAAFEQKPPAAAVPTVSPIGTALLIGLLSILAVGRIRRRFD
ncbi:MAG: hypothetical protein C4B59_06220 [Candidatus Methanogaster sp.]|uniref:Uncharacterized protein n=1 Tax=Candidatus Methanogaster sp. TaxID=3386292 RepID=A0AC61L3W6_9EURY|nr:MAG: hypothetical protein C4B59_06220 [ANME-2 cluster archaeon]